jgi:hypothetical protein
MVRLLALQVVGLVVCLGGGAWATSDGTGWAGREWHMCRYRRVVDLGMTEAQSAWSLRATVARTALVHAALEGLQGRGLPQAEESGERGQSALKILPELRAAQSGLDAVLAVLVVDSGDGLSREADAAFLSVASTPAFAGLRFVRVDAAYEPEAAVSLTRYVPSLILLNPTEDRLRIAAGRVAGERVLAALAESAGMLLRWTRSFLPHWTAQHHRPPGSDDSSRGSGGGGVAGDDDEGSDGALRVLYGPWAPPPLPRVMQEWQRVNRLTGFQEKDRNRSASEEAGGGAAASLHVLSWALDDVQQACGREVGGELESLRRFPDLRRSAIVATIVQKLDRTLDEWSASSSASSSAAMLLRDVLRSVGGLQRDRHSDVARTTTTTTAVNNNNDNVQSHGHVGECWKSALAAKGSMSRLQASLDADYMVNFLRWHALDRQARSALSLGKQAPGQRAAQQLLELERANGPRALRECESVARTLFSVARARLADAQHLHILPPADSVAESIMVQRALHPGQRAAAPAPSATNSSLATHTVLALQDALALVAPSCVDGGLPSDVHERDPLDVPSPPMPAPMAIGGVSGLTTHALYYLAMATMAVGIVWTGTVLRCAATNRRAAWYLLGCFGLLPRPKQPVSLVDVHGRPIAPTPLAR